MQIYLGLRDQNHREEAVKYEIESVRVPKERIALYAAYQFTKSAFGPNDIALVKTREPVFFIPGKIMPVPSHLKNRFLKNIPFVLMIQVCLGRVPDVNVKANVHGFGYSVNKKDSVPLCWTNEKGPNIYQP